MKYSINIEQNKSEGQDDSEVLKTVRGKNYIIQESAMANSLPDGLIFMMVKMRLNSNQNRI